MCAQDPVFAWLNDVMLFCRGLEVLLILNKGPCIFMLHWAPQMIQPVSPVRALDTGPVGQDCKL